MRLTKDSRHVKYINEFAIKSIVGYLSSNNRHPINKEHSSQNFRQRRLYWGVMTLEERVLKPLPSLNRIFNYAYKIGYRLPALQAWFSTTAERDAEIKEFITRQEWFINGGYPYESLFHIPAPVLLRLYKPKTFRERCAVGMTTKQARYLDNNELSWQDHWTVLCWKP